MDNVQNFDRHIFAAVGFRVLTAVILNFSISMVKLCIVHGHFEDTYFFHVQRVEQKNKQESGDRQLLVFA
jgi:hypothetical protein